ncbi:MAG: TatD family hydrolase [Algicola sp.]|nr:TatD family hydrolase [Algicola sp.]
MELIDSHCHLDFAEFDEDRDTLIDSLLTRGVSSVIVPAVKPGNWQTVLDLTAKHDNLYPALGIHPCFLEGSKRHDVDDLAALIEQNPQVIAVGECGLDFTLDNVDEQRYYFTAQIKLAQQFKLPLIIHHRKCHDIILAFLRKFKPQQGGVIHAFSGSYQQAQQYIDLGFKLGIGGTITYSRAGKTREVVCKVPLESLILETDAPDMPIYGRQGERNSPAYLGEVFTVLTLLRDEPAVEIEKQLLANTRSLFSLG